MADNMNDMMNTENTLDDMNFDDLEAMFGQVDSDVARMEKVVLSQNLEGFANCFPDWDLHPPVNA